MELQIKTEQTRPGVVNLSLIGTIDTETSLILDKEISVILKSEIQTLVLDMAGVNYITSAGIGVITKAKASLKKKDGVIAMINLKPQVKKVFEILRLLPSLNVFAHVEELDEYLGKIQKQMIEGEEF